MLLIRVAWLGSQRFPIVMWSGDIPSTFESLKKQVKAGLNASLFGVVYGLLILVDFTVETLRILNSES